MFLPSKSRPPTAMSASEPWVWSLASADGLLTENERYLLRDVDLFKHDEDLLKSFPSAAPKIDLHQLLQDDASSTMYPPSPPDTKPSRAELANDLLQQLETQCKQENIFQNWLEEKVDLPIFENIAQVSERAEPVCAPAPDVVYVPQPVPQLVPQPVPQTVPQTLPQPTEVLLREFETVYGAVELTHLTPPQSPPGPATQLLLSYAQQAQCAPLAPDHWAAPDYDCDSHALEELVRHRAAQLASPQPPGRSASPSPHSSPRSSRSSPPSSPRSSGTDDDWCVSAGRPKPYSRNVDDRRSRKKEQNKNAATRYRQKKKAEIEVLLGEERSLRQRHTDLGEKCSDLQREIRYLKGLMRDLFKAKGLIK